MIWVGPEPRVDLEALAATPHVTLSTSGSWLDAEKVSDQ